MELERFPDERGVAARAADVVATTLRAKPDAVLLLPAGATPVPLYRELVRRARAGALDLSRAHLFQLDEPCGVAPSDPRSFHAFLGEHLLGPLGLGARFRGLDGSARDRAAEIERHRTELEALGGADLALLGLGSNGHVAFNEPGASLSGRAAVVELDSPTRRGLAHRFPEGAPTHGLTLGLGEIAASREIVMLVTGSKKAEMLGHLVRGTPTSARPATLLAHHARFRVLADEAAAGQPAPKS